MYQILIVVYALLVALCNFDKQKSQNSFVFILNFYDASFKNIISDFRIEIKIFDHDCRLNLNEKQTWMWISIVTFLNNMKQQQEFAKFLESKTIKCCHFCNADKQNRKNLNRNIILNDRYYYQILKFWHEASKFNEIIKKKNCNITWIVTEIFIFRHHNFCFEHNSKIFIRFNSQRIFWYNQTIVCSYKKKHFNRQNIWKI